MTPPQLTRDTPIAEIANCNEKEAGAEEELPNVLQPAVPSGLMELWEDF